MASASSGGLASVAPQLNSILALTPRSASRRLVTPTSSVATILPSRSATVWIADACGKAGAQRTLPKLCSAQTSSHTVCTAAALSTTQSLSVRPRSRAPSST